MFGIGLSFRRTADDYVSVFDFQRAAHRRLPNIVRAYVEGGADDVRTRDMNRGGFHQWALQQRVLTGISEPTTSVDIAGKQTDFPVQVAPMGMTGLVHPGGDVALATGAFQAGSRAIISTAASYTMTEIGKSVPVTPPFQLYPIGDRALVERLVAEAKTAGSEELYVTVDCPVRGNREGERQMGLDVNPTLYPRSMLSAALRPRWAWGALTSNRIGSINYLNNNIGITGPRAAIESAAAQDRYMQGSFNWDDLAWIRSLWDGPLFVKGIMHADDAAKAVEEIGAAGVVVSNHGGRQLNSAQSSVSALPKIAERVGSQAEVVLDGGVRRGTDIIIALALGASSVLVGRPALYGLAVNGSAGVRRVLELLNEELVRGLSLMGCASVSELDRSWIERANF